MGWEIEVRVKDVIESFTLYLSFSVLHGKSRTSEIVCSVVNIEMSACSPGKSMTASSTTSSVTLSSLVRHHYCIFLHGPSLPIIILQTILVFHFVLVNCPIYKETGAKSTRYTIICSAKA